MVKNSRTKESGSLTLIEVFFPWPTLVQIPTDHNSSSASVQHPILMVSTPFSEESSQDMTSLKKWRTTHAVQMIYQSNQLKSSIAVNSQAMTNSPRRQLISFKNMLKRVSLKILKATRKMRSVQEVTVTATVELLATVTDLMVNEMN